MPTTTEETLSPKKVALISGVTGQDGSYLVELLLEKGYEVHGIIRRSSSFNTARLEHLYKDPHSRKFKYVSWRSVPNIYLLGTNFILHYGDLTDSTNLVHIVSKVKPDEVYNLGAQSHVKVSFDMSEYTADVDALGTLRLLDAIRTCGMTDKVKFYQVHYYDITLRRIQVTNAWLSSPPKASTSELYGKVQEIPQSEKTPFYPRSPYGI